MPHLRFRGVDEATLCAISQPLVDQLAALVTTSRDNFTLELLTNPFVFDGQRLMPEPMVQVLWFPRPQEVQDRFAQLITDALRHAGEARDIAVFFMALTPNAYYDNGIHY
ncbi:MAG: DUF1904 domain-containing protein [Gammaproteobacteria bacterium]|nr:DUF1904 domain-containing protein [Gammaproteobacteria bacterium]